jgi:hypothetical protein
VVAQFVEALHHKTGGRRFDSQWGHWNFLSDLILVSAFSSLGFTQPVTEMSTRDLPWGVKAAGA